MRTADSFVSSAPYCRGSVDGILRQKGKEVRMSTGKTWEKLFDLRSGGDVDQYQ